MILLTVGMQLPFDRLVKAVDRIAVSLDEEIFGQIGNGSHLPVNFPYRTTIAPTEFDRKVEASRVIVSHAGIGSFLLAKKYSKPIILFPRRADLGEHRNNHQISTSLQLEEHTGVYVANDADELHQHLMTNNLAPVCAQMSDQSRFGLIRNIRDFINSL